jgi:4-hydroxy-2-oxoglutarate aldolase
VAATDWRETLTYFQTVADRSPLPLVLVSGASPAAALDDAMAIELAGHPGVIGLLEEGLDMDHDAERIQRLLLGTKPVRREVLVTMVFQAATGRMLAQVESNSAQFVSAGELSGGGSVVSATPAKPVLKTRTKTVGFQILAGRTAGVLDALRAGAAGAVPPLAASVPQACYEVLAAWKDGDPALAAEKQERLLALAQRVEQELGVAGIKYGCDLTGYFGGRPRLPGLPLKGVEREEIDALMQGIRN